ncbi:MAG: FMN-binding protein [Treponema sp.]|jgi:major membrane immunogen (membrane-anchored lipoprotein)|nr:FMN-binding protein [Treponema sp.]
MTKKNDRGRRAALLCVVCAALASAAHICAALAGCAQKPLRDGVYSGKSSPDDRGACGEITITISRGVVTGCEYVTRQKDGTVKDEQYGKVNGVISNADYYEKAQRAVRAMSAYAERYAKTGSLDAVEAVSGATIAWNQFREAAADALSAAH